MPDVLRSGNHAAIARWRRDRALERTAARRPDLLAALPDGALDRADRAFLAGAADDGLISLRRIAVWHYGLSCQRPTSVGPAGADPHAGKAPTA